AVPTLDAQDQPRDVPLGHLRADVGVNRVGLGLGRVSDERHDQRVSQSHGGTKVKSLRAGPSAGPEMDPYCLSKKAMLEIFLPFASVPLVVTVRLLPSAATAMRPLMVTLPPFLTVKPSVWSSIFL